LDEWTRPDPFRMALLTIDIQREFQPGFPSGRSDNATAVPAAAEVTRAFRNAGKPIIHIVRLYLPDASNADLCRRSRILSGPPILAPGSESSQIAQELLPLPSVVLDHHLLLSGGVQVIGPAEWIIYKPRFGSFYKTPLERHLAELGVNTIVVVGSNFPNCPRTTIYEASERDLRIVAVTDAISLLDHRGICELEAIGVLCIPLKKALELLFPH